MDRKEIRGRVVAEDVLQDVYLDAEKRLSHFAVGDFPRCFSGYVWSLAKRSAVFIGDIFQRNHARRCESPALAEEGFGVIRRFAFPSDSSFT